MALRFVHLLARVLHALVGHRVHGFTPDVLRIAADRAVSFLHVDGDAQRGDHEGCFRLRPAFFGDTVRDGPGVDFLPRHRSVYAAAAVKLLERKKGVVLNALA